MSAAQTSRGEDSLSSARPLSELTGFRTRKGVVLLYEPDPLDVWIGKRIEKTAEGDYVDTQTGKALSRQGGKKYVAYLKRHESRNETARQADKLFHIVDKYLPLQADETRAFIARFPDKVYTLLPKARKIRNKLRQAGEMQPTSGESTLPSQGDDPEHSPGEALLQQTEETYHDVTEHKQAETTEGESSQQSAALQGELPRPEEGADYSEAHREWCAGGVQFQMRTPHQTGGTSKQMTTYPTTTTGRGGNLEGLPTKDTVKAFWGKGPTSQRAHREMGG